MVLLKKTAAVLTLLCLAGLVRGAEIDERPWLEVRSENFRIRSVLGEDRTVELLRHLEIMRATLGDVESQSTYESPVPTMIIAVDSREDYVSIGAPDNSVGFFFADLRENAILIEDTDDSSGVQVLLHEFAHYLSQQSGRIRYPRWFEEGNAEYLSHSRLGNNTFEYALAPEQHIAVLNFASWLPLARMLEITDTWALEDDEGGLFYAQAWLIVHYLRSLPDAERNLPTQLSEYSRLASAGMPPTDAFELAFATDVARLEDEILQYYLNREFVSRTVPANTALPGFSSRVRPVSATEAQLTLARMAMRFDNIDGAERWFEKALDDEEMRAHAEAGLGRIAGQRGEIDTATERFETAIYLMAWDFTIWMDYAQFWAQRVSMSVDNKDRTRNASRLIQALESALTIAEATPELNSLMGFAYLAKGNDPYEAIEYLEAAADAAPHDQASRLLLANAYLYVGRFGDAIDLAESILRFEHQPGIVTAAAHDVIGQARERRAR